MTKERFLILLVEDEENDAFLMLRAFKKAGVMNRVQWVKNGLEALDYFEGRGDYGDRQKFPLPHAVILDLKLPKLSGFELLAWMRDTEQFRSLPVIVLTASSLHSDISRARQLGATEYLVKPSAFNELVGIVRSLRDYLGGPGESTG